MSFPEQQDSTFRKPAQVSHRKSKTSEPECEHSSQELEEMKESKTQAKQKPKPKPFNFFCIRISSNTHLNEEDIYAFLF